MFLPTPPPTKGLFRHFLQEVGRLTVHGFLKTPPQQSWRMKFQAVSCLGQTERQIKGPARVQVSTVSMWTLFSFTLLTVCSNKACSCCLHIFARLSSLYLRNCKAVAFACCVLQVPIYHHGSLFDHSPLISGSSLQGDWFATPPHKLIPVFHSLCSVSFICLLLHLCSSRQKL